MIEGGREGPMTQIYTFVMLISYNILISKNIDSERLINITIKYI